MGQSLLCAISWSRPCQKIVSLLISAKWSVRRISHNSCTSMNEHANTKRLLPRVRSQFILPAIQVIGYDNGSSIIENDSAAGAYVIHTASVGTNRCLRCCEGGRKIAAYERTGLIWALRRLWGSWKSVYIRAASQRGARLDVFSGGEQTSAVFYFIFYLISFVVAKSPVIDDRDTLSPADPAPKEMTDGETEVAGVKKRKKKRRLICPPSARVTGGSKLSFSFAPLLALLLLRSQLEPQRPALVHSRTWSSDSVEIMWGSLTMSTCQLIRENIIFGLLILWFPSGWREKKNSIWL